MSKIKGLGYIGCEVSDFNSWDKLLDTVYGLERRGDSGKSVRQYRMDDNHHRLALHKLNDNKLKYIGWEVEFQGDLDNLAAELSDKGIEVKAGSAYDIVHENKAPLALTLGRHTNDNMMSFYIYSPSGWWVEYGHGARLIDDADWEPKLYNSPKIWGHEMLPPPAAVISDGKQHKR